MIITIAWMVTWRTGCRLVRNSGVTDRIDVLTLGSVLPTAGLVACIHITALLSLPSSVGLVTPESIAILFVVLAGLAHRLVPLETPGGLRRSRLVAHLFRGGGYDDRPNSTPPVGRAIYLPILIVAAMYAVFLLDALTRYPTGYDCLNYHLPATVGWIQNRSMDLIVGLINESYPENAMCVPMLLLFAGLEKLVILVNVPSIILCAMLVFALARATSSRATSSRATSSRDTSSNATRVSRSAAILASCIALSIPIIVFQTFSNYIDLYAAVAWLCSLLALVWATRVEQGKQRRRLILLAGLAAGVALGSKMTYFALVFLLMVLVGLLDWLSNHRMSSRCGTGFQPVDAVAPVPRVSNRWMRWHRCNEGLVCGCWRSVVRNIVLFVTATLVCSSFWFIRGTVQAGNPLYPLTASVANEKILPGFAAEDFFPQRPLSKRIARWWDYPWREPKIGQARGYNYGVDNGLGMAFAVFVPIGFLVVLIGLVQRSGVAPPFYPLLKGGNRGVPRMSNWCNSNLAGQQHPLLRSRLCDPSRGTGLQPDSARTWRAVFICLSACGMVLLLSIFHETLRFILPLVLLAVSVSAPIFDRLIEHRPRATLTLVSLSLACTAGIATLKPAKEFLGRLRDGVEDRATFYEIPPMIDRLPVGARVLNLGLNEANYPLLGKDLTNVVITPSHWRLLTRSTVMSAEALRQHRIDYVCAIQPLPTDWPTDLPLVPVDDNSSTRCATTTTVRTLYRVDTPTYQPGGLAEGTGYP